MPTVRDHVEDAWLASDDGAVCGYCVVKDRFLDFLLVDVRKHGRGIGTRLLDHAEQLMFGPTTRSTWELRGQRSCQHLTTPSAGGSKVSGTTMHNLVPTC